MSRRLAANCSRSAIFSTIIGLTSLALIASFASRAQAKNPPNILFIFSDDHAYQAVGAYGSGLNKTPNIGRLAAEGMRFNKCYVTNSLCGPSRACILTGKYSHKNGFFSNKSTFDSSQTTFATIMQDAGYQTAVIGKWHLVSQPVGFTHWDVLPGQGRYYSPEFIAPKGRYVEPGYVTDVITDKALTWLKEDRDERQPFMLMVQNKAPHRSWEPEIEHLDDYKDKTFPEPETLFDDYKNRSDAPRRATMRISENLNPTFDLMIFQPDSPHAERFFQLTSDKTKQAWFSTFQAENAKYLADPPTGKEKTKWNYQRYIKNYLRCVSRVDDNVGRLLDYLEESGQADNTIVVYASDQGFYLGEHGWFDKRFMYEESLRTPFIVRWPGHTKPGSVDEHIVSNVDFAETFLDFAGLQAPQEMQGKSLVPILKGEQPEQWRENFYYQFYEGPPAVHTVDEHYGVTDSRHKLIHFYKIDQWELYDLKKDPQEMVSVYNDPAYAEVQQRLKEQIKRLRKELGVKNNKPVRTEEI